MTNAAVPAEADDAATATFHDPLASGFPKTGEGRFLFWFALTFSLFQIVTAAHLVVLPSQVVRAFHVGFLLALCFPLIASARRGSVLLRLIAWLLALAGFGVALYQFFEYGPLLLRAGDPSQLDLIVGVISLGTLFVAAWVVMGPALPLICAVFLAYCLFGQYLPSPINHRGYGFDQVIDHMAYGTEGIYGIPVLVSSTYIFLFILFGSFLERAGMIKLFTDVSLGLVGRSQGGAGKVAVISSGLMGTISGSGVANVVTTGQFTIPLMKRFGYRPAFAGGVEATSSMGAQLMPPVMGAVAFIMAETIGVEYIEIVKAAIIPAILYFASAFWMVHLEAGKHGLYGLPRSELPSPLAALRRQWFLILPLAGLVYLLFAGYTPLYAGTIGLALTVLLILGGSIALKLPSMLIRVIFWVGVALVFGAFLRFGSYVVVGAVLLLIAINALFSGGRATLALCRDSLAEGARTALPVGIACAIVGIIIGTMTLTGMANEFGQFIVHVGQNNLLLSLALTMVTCLLLGMGIPTVPNYIITATIAGPALLKLGVPLLVGHMFVFYFGILADLTPPVALACFAAAPIAKANGLRISLEAIKIALAGFVIPYIAVYSPELMLQGGSALTAQIGIYPATAYAAAKTAFAIALWGAAVVGFLHHRMGLFERVLATISALLLIVAIPVTDGLGFALGVIVVAWHLIAARRAVAEKPTSG